MISSVTHVNATQNVEFHIFVLLVLSASKAYVTYVSDSRT